MNSIIIHPLDHVNVFVDYGRGIFRVLSPLRRIIYASESFAIDVLFAEICFAADNFFSCIRRGSGHPLLGFMERVVIEDKANGAARNSRGRLNRIECF